MPTRDEIVAGAVQRMRHGTDQIGSGQYELDKTTLALALLDHPYGTLKPLEWYPVNAGQSRRCDTAFGRYLVDVDYWWGPNCTSGAKCSSNEDGEEQCQADYEQQAASLFTKIGDAT